ncbi:MAG TPA: hypothetical protein PLH91_06970 [Tenuifilaceae bacterium]|nr:hypothetical protein [Tenuifilaceae bacterium]HPI44955.1 hypothetical protein [Tenuifilaceae bacterium]HPN21775.1 hypothetical protein [Tenuifilaceae bacterium]
MKRKGICFGIIIILILALFACKKDESTAVPPLIVLKIGDGYTSDLQEIPAGGSLKFGVKAYSKGDIITNLRIQRFADGKKITEEDKGLYNKDSIVQDFSYNKSLAEQEVWTFFVMNSNRDSVSVSLTVNLGIGYDYGQIYHFPSLKIGFQNNTEYPNYLDLHTGLRYTKDNVSGHEADIDLVGFFYVTSGKDSPTLCCPGYTGSSSITAPERYPEIASWTIRRSTLYDYNSSDNNLVSVEEFEKATTDSLLTASYIPEKVSGLCKYTTAGRIIPLKTEDGKYGLIRVIHADLNDEGYMEIEVKIQK